MEGGRLKAEGLSRSHASHGNAVVGASHPVTEFTLLGFS